MSLMFTVSPLAASVPDALGEVVLAVEPDAGLSDADEPLDPQAASAGRRRAAASATPAPCRRWVRCDMTLVRLRDGARMEISRAGPIRPGPSPAVPSCFRRRSGRDACLRTSVRLGCTTSVELHGCGFLGA